MIFNKYFIILLVFSFFFSSATHSQNIIDINEKLILSSINDSTCEYIMENGNIITAYTSGIEFKGGRSMLKYYLDSAYYNNPIYKNHIEFNVVEHFFVLFDSELNIREVRIMYRRFDSNKRYYYDTVFIDALKNTKGRWKATKKGKEWYVYLHSQRIF